MTVTDMEQYRPIAVPARIGQATAVEQSRAAAEVMAAVQVAIQFPRSENEALRKMREACGHMALAQRAFYSFPRAGGRVTGPTIQLAKELARCWGHMRYSVDELHRDDELGQSEVQAWAWDVQEMVRSSATFIVPHGRDTKEGVVKLTELRDVYENNANAGARRLREQIMSTLPVWFREEAMELCRQTLNNRGDAKMPMPQQRARAVEAYEGIGVKLAELERHVGASVDAWLVADLADLNVLFREIQDRKVSRDDVFRREPLTDMDLKQTPRQGPDGRAASWGAVQYQPQQENPAEPAQPVGEEWPPVRQPGGE